VKLEDRPTLSVADISDAAQRVIANVEKVIVGKHDAVHLTLIAVICRGHVLIEDVPGVGKTVLTKAIARSIGCTFKRIQFTPDLLPSDVTGVSMFNQRVGEFEFRAGPIMSQFVLADEINRATPKTQSALLEAMNELQVTIDGRSHPLDQPFMVVATQNPVEHHGTYPLPESQLDRFLMRIRIGYPDAAAEREIVRRGGAQPAENMRTVLSGDELVTLQDAVARVNVDEALVDYMLAIVERTRTHESLAMGVSPRGAQALYRATQALAAVEGRDYATPDDIKRLALPVFAHRVVVNSRVALAPRSAEAGERVLSEILTLVDVPL